MEILKRFNKKARVVFAAAALLTAPDIIRAQEEDSRPLPRRGGIVLDTAESIISDSYPVSVSQLPLENSLQQSPTPENLAPQTREFIEFSTSQILDSQIPLVEDLILRAYPQIFPNDIVALPIPSEYLTNEQNLDSSLLLADSGTNTEISRQIELMQNFGIEGNIVGIFTTDDNARPERFSTVVQLTNDMTIQNLQLSRGSYIAQLADGSIWFAETDELEEDERVAFARVTGQQLAQFPISPEAPYTMPNDNSERIIPITQNTITGGLTGYFLENTYVYVISENTLINNNDRNLHVYLIPNPNTAVPHTVLEPNASLNRATRQSARYYYLQSSSEFEFVLNMMQKTEEEFWSSISEDGIYYNEDGTPEYVLVYNERNQLAYAEIQDQNGNPMLNNDSLENPLMVSTAVPREVVSTDRFDTLENYDAERIPLYYETVITIDPVLDAIASLNRVGNLQLNIPEIAPSTVSPNLENFLTPLNINGVEQPLGYLGQITDLPRISGLTNQPLTADAFLMRIEGASARFTNNDGTLIALQLLTVGGIDQAGYQQVYRIIYPIRNTDSFNVSWQLEGVNGNELYSFFQNQRTISSNAFDNVTIQNNIELYDRVSILPTGSYVIVAIPRTNPQVGLYLDGMQESNLTVPPLPERPNRDPLPNTVVWEYSARPIIIPITSNN